MSKDIRPLTSLRFFAATLILCEHVRPAFHCLDWISASFPLNYGVSFFFVLSGFILAYVYRDLAAREGIVSFYVARIARIWPLHIASLLIFLAVQSRAAWFYAGQSQHAAIIATSNVLLLQSWIPNPAYFWSLNGVAWSISTEMFFYLMFPMLQHNWASTWKWKCSAVVMAAATILTVATLAHNPDAIFNQGIGYIFPVVRLPEFVLGMAVCHVFLKAGDRLRGGVTVWTLFEGASVCLIAACYLIGSRLLNHGIPGLDGSTPLAAYVANNGAGVGCGVVMFVFAFQRGLLSKALSIKPLVVLGEASFALYMVHQALVWFIFNHQGDVLSRVPEKTQLAGYLVITFVCAFALRYFVEEPARKLIRSGWAAFGKNQIRLSR